MSDLWPHQERAIDGVLAALTAGKLAPLVVGPTGCGKTRIAGELTEGFVKQSKTVGILTNRRLMVDQLRDKFSEHGIDCGIRAAGYRRSSHAPVQIVSVQTEHSRVTKREEWEAFVPDIALVDEAHLQTSAAVRVFLNRVVDRGGRYVGFTATPVDVAGFYDCLVDAGTPSELRACGALVTAHHYGPDEPDLRRAKKKMLDRLKAGDDVPEEAVREAMMTPDLFGRVWEHFNALNPEQRPTLLFAPDVGGSLWFAQQFWKNGITAAHIDGSGVWWNGEEHTGKAVRDDLRKASEEGELVVVCNRFVLREGVDWPWLEHGIFATIFGSLPTYLQSGGRLLRASPRTGKERAVIQDHGGNWHRHGSLNADRVWFLDGTRRMYAGLRADAIRDGREKEPARCPKCGAIQRQIYVGMTCWAAGCDFVFASARRARPVRTAEGTLVELQGDVYQPRKVREYPTTAGLWAKQFYRARASKKGMTFAQAEALFVIENHYWPPRNLPLMPRHAADWYRKVKDVAPEDLL